MQRVSSFLPSWDRRKSANKPVLEKSLMGWAAKSTTSHKASPTTSTTTAVTAPVKVGKEAFWPGTLDGECDRAARILKSFCCKWCNYPTLPSHARNLRIPIVACDGVFKRSYLSLSTSVLYPSLSTPTPSKNVAEYNYHVHWEKYG
jgi:hypothetical protein